MVNLYSIMNTTFQIPHCRYTHLQLLKTINNLQSYINIYIFKNVYKYSCNMYFNIHNNRFKVELLNCYIFIINTLNYTKTSYKIKQYSTLFVRNNDDTK